MKKQARDKAFVIAVLKDAETSLKVKLSVVMLCFSEVFCTHVWLSRWLLCQGVQKVLDPNILK